MATNNVLLAQPNFADRPTVKGGAWSLKRHLQRLLTDQPSDFARAIGADPRNSWFYVDLGAAEECGVLALSELNATTSGQVRVRAFNADPTPALDAVLTGSALPSWLTVTRASVGTYIGLDGLLKTAQNNEARFNFEAGGLRGLLREEAATNALTQPRDGSNAAWTKTNMTAAKTATGLDGVVNAATRLTATAANARITQGGGAGGGVFSVDIRRVSGTGNIKLTGNNFGATTTLVGVTTSYQRFYVVAAGSSTVGIQLDTSGDVIEFDCAQVETGTVPTSRILTGGATRAAETLVANTLNGVSFAGSTIVIKCAPIRLPGSTQYLAKLEASSADLLGVTVTSGGATAVNMLSTFVSQVTGLTGPVLAAGTVMTVALSWAANDVRASFDGAAALTDASATMPIGAAPTLSFGANMDLVIQAIRVYSSTKVNADLVSLSGAELEVVPAWDDGATDVWPAAYVAATTARERAGMPGVWMRLLSPTRTYRWWRYDILDSTNPKPLQVARVLMCPAFQPVINMSFGAGTGFEARDIVVETPSGAEYGARLRPRRVTRFSLGLISEAEAFGEHWEMHRLGVWSEVLFSWNPNDTTHRPRRTYVGRLRKLSLLETPQYALFTNVVEVSERI